MYYQYLNSNRYKLTKFVFCVFVIIGILNLNFGFSFVTYADEEPVPVEEAPVVDVVEAPLQESVSTPEAPVENTEETISGDSSANTGDALSESIILNEQNTNVIDTNTSTSTATTTEEAIFDDSEASILTSPIASTATSTTSTTTDLTISGENTATTSNVVIGEANTGNNTASSTATTTISTGDAIATADIINEVNTTIVNSEGDIAAGSGSLGESSLDLRNGLENQGSTGCGSCVATVSIENQNTATVTNEVYLVASTGNNTSSGSNSVVNTGDAYAGTNVVNIINTNIIDSNYLLFVFNNFGNWSGDFVLPNGDFFSNFFRMLNQGTCNNCAGETNIKNTNEATVTNSLNTVSDSGNNSVIGGDAYLSTGDALSSSNVYNEVNTNVYNDSSFYLVIKIVGDWVGNIFNLPENIGWQNTEDGIILYDKSHNPFEQLEQNLNQNALSAENSNSAFIENNIDLEASTGENSLTGDISSLNTGNAFSGANLVNIVNTNIVSSNWIRALVNVFGNWSGNISFGQPDLWVGTVLNTEGEIGPASLIKFKTTIKNNGDAPASQIRLIISSDSENLRFSDNLEKILEVGNLLPGEVREIEYDGLVNPLLQFGNSNINNSASLSLFESDANISDNSDTLRILAINRNEPTVILPYKERGSSYPNLVVNKTHTLPNSVSINGSSTVPIGSSVDYKIIIKNNGGSAFEGRLFDQLKNEAGEVINEQVWELDQIFPEETIEITYTTNFNSSTTPGIYTNYAWVESLAGDYSYNRAFATEFNSNIAFDIVVVFALPTMPTIEEDKGEVLGMLNQNALGLLGEENYRVETENYYLGGLCVDTKKEDGKISIKETLLYSLSFVLIVRRKKNIPMNLFML